MTHERSAVLGRVAQQLPPIPDAFDRLRMRRDRRVIRRRAAGAVAGVGLTVALVSALLTLRVPDEGLPVGGSDRTGSTVQLVAEPGQYYYVRFESAETTNERWYGPDGSGRFTTHVDGVLVDDRSFSTGELTQKLYSDLSTDPDVLRMQLLDRSGSQGASPISVPTPALSPTEDTVVLMAMADLLEFGSDYLVPEQIAAVFRAASAMQGVTVGRGADPVGRDAIFLSWTYRDDDSAVAVRWYFEPATRQFMGEQRFDSATGGGVLSMNVIEVAGIVTSTNDRPPPLARYVPRALASSEMAGNLPAGADGPSSAPIE